MVDSVMSDPLSYSSTLNECGILSGGFSVISGSICQYHVIQCMRYGITR